MLAGGDVRIEDDLIAKVNHGEVMSLGDHRLHVLLELPHELYFPLDSLLEAFHSAGMQGILSHPERNEGLLANPGLLSGLVEAGCLMQVTCGSLLGTFGPKSQQLAEQMLSDGLVHFMASDGHGARRRRPRMGGAHRRVAELIGKDLADELCCHNPSLVAAGRFVEPGPRVVKKSNGFANWFSRKRAA